MKISDLNHLEIISEAPKVVGGNKKNLFRINNWFSQFQNWFTKKQPIEQTVVSKNSTADGKGSTYAAIGAYKDGGGFTLVSSSYRSWYPENI